MTSTEKSYINKPNGEEADHEYAKRMLENIEKGHFNSSRQGELLNTDGPINLEQWTTLFIEIFNGDPTTTTIEKDDHIIVDGSRNSPSSASAESDPKQTKLIGYSDPTAANNKKNYPFINASVLDSIGDGTCLVHSYFNALSPTYRSLAKKYQRLIGLFFRKYVYANSLFLNKTQKDIAKRLQSDSGEETYLDDSDAENLSKLLGTNTLIFSEDANQGNNCRYIKVNEDPAIFLFYSTTGTHYDTIRFTNDNYTQPDAWIQTNLPTAYEVGNAVYLQGTATGGPAVSFDLADVFLREASQFLGREAKRSISPSDLFLDAVSNFLAPPKNKKSATFKDEDNMSDVSDDGEETIEEYIPAIYDRLNHYLGHIYKVMKSIKKSGDKKQFRDMGTDPASKFAPTTIENNTECNGPFTVEVQTIKTDVQGNQIENSTECL